MGERPENAASLGEQATQESHTARRRPRVLRIALLILLIPIPLIAAGVWYSKYDPPIERTAPGEWMTDLRPEQIAQLVEPEGRPRWLDFPGVVNARDLGGYPTYDGKTTRWGVLFRSGRLRDLDEHGCEVFRSLNIHTVIDLRDRLIVDTTLHDGDPACVQAAANMELFRFIPPRKKGDTKAEAIRALVRRNTNTIKNVCETLADQGRFPLLYHCTQGRDRAGIISFVLLDMLGVDRRIIRAEYDLSGEVGKSCDYENINAIFADIDAAGGIHQYLYDMGVPFKVQRRIRENLLE
ncbi:MAG: tyrosine-protein phosphatase [Phycisphaerales bacterium]|nr:MAG: tyrosine-protein phosphatase [Phycisphaerales bacterium]